MPLATDTSFFNTDDEVEKQRDIAFVGNSSFEFLDLIVNEERSSELQNCSPCRLDMKNRYLPTQGLISAVFSRRIVICGKGKQIFRSKYFVLYRVAGRYLYGREFIKGIAEKYGSRFTCLEILTGRILSIHLWYPQMPVTTLISAGITDQPE